MQRSCLHCSSTFEITDDDLAFYEKVSPVFGGKAFSIPAPTLCPSCREQRRLTHHNHRHLHRRVSDYSHKEIVSIYSQDKGVIVYEPSAWWSDAWDPLSFGMDVVFDQTFFQQMKSVFRRVPVMSLFIDSNENSPYVNDTGWAKNCHVCFGADYSEDCLYCESVYYSRSALDCLYCYNVEVSYECVDCKDCHTLLFSQGCTTCADSAFLFDCIGCNHCFGCVGLRHKTYCMFNKQLSQEEYKKKVDTYLPFTLSSIQRSSEATLQCKLQHPHRAFIGNNNENVIGNHLFNAKNVEYCFDSTDIEDVKYATNMRGAKDCQDINYWGHPGELCYECMAVGEGATRLAFCIASWGGCENLYYCHACIACRDCFGCKGLRHKRYCILNKQYSKEQYESLVPRLIEYMKKTQEWGEMFPVTFSDFAYNETPAQEYHPLSKEEVEHRGWRWLQETNESLKVAKVIPASQLPEKIGDIPDDILNWAIECETTKRPFKIAKQELDFYRAQKLPIPHFHPDERHRRRMLMRNPRKLWKRQCANCQKEIQTSYAPDRPEIVYCEECYLKAVY